MGGRALDLRALAEPALFVPETMTLMKFLEQVKRTHLPVALVVDEFGDTQGLVIGEPRFHRIRIRTGRRPTASARLSVRTVRVLPRTVSMGEGSG
jgi:hypothetical protein